MKQLIFKENNKPYLIMDLAVYNEAELVVRENEEGLYRVVRLPHIGLEELNLNEDTLLDTEKLLQLSDTYKTIVETQEVLVKAHNF